MKIASQKGKNVVEGRSLRTISTIIDCPRSLNCVPLEGEHQGHAVLAHDLTLHLVEEHVLHAQVGNGC